MPDLRGDVRGVTPTSGAVRIADWHLAQALERGDEYKHDAQRSSKDAAAHRVTRMGLCACAAAVSPSLQTQLELINLNGESSTTWSYS